MDDRDALRDRRILIVEDNYLVAQVLIDMLEYTGAVVLGPVGDLDEALALAKDGSSNIDCAVLDVDLHGRASYPIADALTERGVHFVFTTGYDASALDKKYRDHPRCSKPFEERAILAALAQCVRGECRTQEPQ